MAEGTFKSIDIVREQLMEHRYINDESLACSKEIGFEEKYGVRSTHRHMV